MIRHQNLRSDKTNRWLRTPKHDILPQLFSCPILGNFYNGKVRDQSLANFDFSRDLS